MSDPDTKKPNAKAENPAAGAAAPASKRSGRVAFDSRGNPIWEWQLETGVYSRDVSTQKLKKLDLGDLSIAETATHQRPEGLEDPRKKSPGGGFNPYDRGARDPGAGSNPYDNAGSAGRKFTGGPGAAPERKPTDLRKLDEWIKMKKSLKDKKDD